MNVITFEKGQEPQQLNLNSSTTGTIGIANGIVNSGMNTACWPYHYYPNWYQTYYQPKPWVSVEQAENGFIVVKDGKTYVCQNAEEIIKIISKKA